MLIDHTAYAFDGLLFFASVPVLRAIGRIAFPIFAYFVGEGFRHTRDVRKYLARLGLFAFVSEIPFTLVFQNATLIARGGQLDSIVFFSLASHNVIFTLFLGLSSAYVLRLAKYSPAFYAAIPVLIILGDVLNTDFGSIGVVMVFACAAITGRSRSLRLGILLAGGLVLYLPFASTNPAFSAMLIAGYCFALLLLILYNGKRGPAFKWLFYVFYPGHLLLIFGALLLARGFV